MKKETKPAAFKLLTQAETGTLIARIKTAGAKLDKDIQTALQCSARDLGDALAEHVHALIACGHAGALHYTLAQVRYWAAVAARARSARQRDLLLLMRAAQATQEGFEQVMQALEQASDGR